MFKVFIELRKRLQKKRLKAKKKEVMIQFKIGLRLAENPSSYWFLSTDLYK